ncbi:TPR-like protein [Peniophora sp. CONT]|nr:TPR-like protein [Peniophora sp. CONT]
MPEGHPEVSTRLHDLGASLETRFRHIGELADLERAIALFRNAINLTPTGHPNMAGRLVDLGIALLGRFQHVGGLSNLNEAIANYRRANELTPEGHPDKHRQLAQLGVALFNRFQHRGELDDLERAVENHQHAVKLTPEGHPGRPQQLEQLGASLANRFRHLGELDDLESAIENHQQAVKFTPDGHPGKPLRLALLGVALLNRFRHLGELDDLERAIENHQQAVKFTPDGHPGKPLRLTQLGVALLDRFQHLGELEDLERAIENLQHAVKLTSEEHPDKPLRLAELGTSLAVRFQHLGELGDLEGAIEHHQHAIKLTPEGHPDKPSRLAELGVALLDRFQHTGKLNDLERAIETHQHAVKLTTEGHPEKPRRLAALGVALFNRFQHRGELDDLERAVTNFQDAVKLTPEAHTDKPKRLADLGVALANRFQHRGELDDVEVRISSCRTTNEQSLGKPSIRLDSAREFVTLLTQHYSLGSAELLLRAHSHVMGILPELVWLGHSIGRRYQETAKLTNTISTAVTVAIYFDKLSQAIEWLEAGRSLIWSQIISLRMPLSDLKEQHPNLAEDLEDVSKELQRWGHLPRFSTALKSDEVAPHVSGFAPSDGMADSHRRLAIQYDRTLRDIRHCLGFEDFLRPPKFASLLPVLKHLDRPVIFINVHPQICDALALCLDGSIARIPLPNLTEKRAHQLRFLWMQNLERCHTRVRRAMMPDISPARGDAYMFGRILARLWTWVVQPILQHLNLITIQSDSARLPHITWCPTGPLTQLPLHAAGIYDVKQNYRPHIFDFVVSSYTPSLSALLRCSQSLKHRSSQPNMLVVAQPATPGLTHLPGTKKECACIRAIIPDTAYTLLEHEQAVVEKTAAVIDKYPWVHFACHGVQDATDPTQSAFALYDGRLTLSMLMGTVADNVELAFLSACQTAVGDEKIPEESAHLAAGMLVVGFKGVIATMWSIGDEDAPIVAEAYYKKLMELRSSGAVGTGQTGAAYALHEAVKVLREKVGEQNFVKWAPFVHFGV